MNPQPVFAWELIELSWPHRSGLRSCTPCANVLTSAPGSCRSEGMVMASEADRQVNAPCIAK